MLPDEPARLIALDLFPGREWKDLTEGEQERCRQELVRLRRILGENVGESRLT